MDELEELYFNDDFDEEKFLEGCRKMLDAAGERVLLEEWLEGEDLAALEPFDVIVDPGDLGIRPGRDLVEMVEAQRIADLFQLRANPLDPLEVIGDAAARAVQRFGPGAVALAGPPAFSSRRS